MLAFTSRSQAAFFRSVASAILAASDGRLACAEAVAKALPVIKSEIVAIVGVAIKVDAILREGMDQCLAMQRLVVDKHAVEVEQDCLGHSGI